MTAPTESQSRAAILDLQFVSWLSESRIRIKNKTISELVWSLNHLLDHHVPPQRTDTEPPFFSGEWKRAQISGARQNPQPADSDSRRLIDWLKVCSVSSRRRARPGQTRTEPRPRLRSAAEECAKSSVHTSQTLLPRINVSQNLPRIFGPAGAKTTCNHKDQQTLNSFYRGSPWPTTGQLCKEVETHTHTQFWCPAHRERFWAQSEQQQLQSDRTVTPGGRHVTVQL